MAMDSLVKFSTEVIKTAENQRDALLSKVRDKENKRLQAAKADIQSKKLSKIRIECTKIKLEADKEVSVIKNDLNKEIFKRRAEMFDDIFSEVIKNLKEYKNSSCYTNDIIQTLNAALLEMGAQNTECFVLDEDIDLLKKEFPSLIIREATKDILGGFSLMNREKGLYLDMTLKSKVEEQKKKFYKKSGLVLN